MSDQPGIGVLLCACRPEMKERLDYESLISYISSLEGVAHVERHPVWCLAPGLIRIRQVIEEKGIDRIVVAGCSYRIHRRIFSELLREAGLNPYMLEIVNLRDHCAAVHPDGATERARDQIEMAVVRARELQPLTDITTDSVQRALIIGGGLSGLIAADTLAASGCEVTIVEQEETLGGHMSRARPWRVRRNGREALPEIVAAVEANPTVDTVCSSTVSRVDGEPGGFTATIATPGGDRQIEAGAIIIATGSAPIPADGAYGYDGVTVRTQEEFERLLYTEEQAEKPLSIVLIQCVNSRNEERPYCSRVCCLDSVRNATAARQKWPDTEVAILFRDLEKGCLTERDVKRARDAGVAFYRFDEAAPPKVENGKVKLVDTLTGKEVAILYDLIVLSLGEAPAGGTGDTARALNVPPDAFGFLPEPTMRIRPKDFTGRGIFVTGSAHWPLTPEESMYQAFEMASRAAKELKKGTLTTRPIVASVDESKCIGCHLCESMCAWDAIRVSEPAEGNKARVREILCKGCGTCVASCPAFAIQITYYSDEQIRPAIRAAVTS